MSERVESGTRTDHHGINPQNPGSRCGHCHRTYSAALKCSMKLWPEQVGGEQ